VGRTAVTRRQFITNSLAAVAGIALPTAAYAQFIEPHRISLTRLELRIPRLGDAFDGFGIAQLSDFHCGPYTGASEILASVAAVNSLAPDIVVLTGDFITASYEKSVTDRTYTDAAQCAQFLSGLHATHGVYGCYGNHDCAFNANYLDDVFSSYRMRLFRNANMVIERNGQRLWLASLDDALCGTPDFGIALKGIPAGDPIVLLAHEPDLADEAARYPIAVQLSGHSHGGQIRLPLIGSLYLPPLARKYPYGYYQVGNLHLYTNRGIGTIDLPYRFNAPPEVTLVTLRTA
jgi:predicted MPP superfamily phosphohydrolase